MCTKYSFNIWSFLLSTHVKAVVVTHTSMFGTVCSQSIEREVGVNVPRTHQTDTDPSGSQLTPQTVEIAVQRMFRGGVCGREREREVGSGRRGRVGVASQEER